MMDYSRYSSELLRELLKHFYPEETRYKNAVKRELKKRKINPVDETGFIR